MTAAPAWRLLLVLIVLLLGGAAAPDQVIPMPGGGNQVVMPAHGLVTFKTIDSEGVVHFAGAFVLEGEYSYSCLHACEPEADLALAVRPSPAIARRLPGFRGRDLAGPGLIYIYGEQAFVRSHISAAQRKALLSGKLEKVSGPARILVDDLAGSIQCDGTVYTARYIGSRAKEPVATFPEARFGCG